MSFADRWKSRAVVPWLVLRIDARRPAAWIAAVTAAGCAAGLPDPGQGTPVVAAAIACGGLVAVASIGRLPRGMPAGGRRLWRWFPVLRAAWPVIGFLAGSVAIACWGHGVAVGNSGVAALASVATAVAAVVGPTAARGEATTASRVLGSVAGAALAAWTLWAGGAAPVFQGLGGLLAGGLLAAALMPERGIGRREWPESAGGRASGPDRGPLVAMIASLLAMAGCFFLAPQFAWGYAVVATGLFVCLAVPQATEFGPAAAGFVRSVAGHPPLPGSLPRAMRVTATYAGILVWPALVASLLPAVGGGRVGGPGEAIAWLGCSAAGLILAVAAAVPAGRGDAARSAVLAAAAVAVVVAVNLPARFAIPLGLPAFPGAGLTLVGGTGVEGFQPTCETSQATQPPGPHPGVEGRSRIGVRLPDNRRVGSCRL